MEGSAGFDFHSSGKHVYCEGETAMKTVTEIAGKKLSLVNIDKDIYPLYGFTKAQIMDYYRRISTFIHHHLQDRALTLKRYHNGVEEGFFLRSAARLTGPSGYQRLIFLSVTKNRLEPALLMIFLLSCEWEPLLQLNSTCLRREALLLDRLIT